MDEWMFSLPPPQLQHCLPVYLLLSRAHSQSSGGTQHHEPPSAPDHELSGPAPPGGTGALFPGTEGRTQEPLWQGEAAFTVRPKGTALSLSASQTRGGRLIRILIIRPTLVLVSGRRWRSGINTWVSARPQCSVVANVPPISTQNRHVRANAAPFTSCLAHCSSCCPALPCCRAATCLSSTRAAVRKTHVLLTTDALTDHGREDAQRGLELLNSSKQNVALSYVNVHTPLL